MFHLKTLLIILSAVVAWMVMVVAVGLTVLIVSPLLRFAYFLKTKRIARDRSPVRTSFRDQESTQY